VPPGVAGVDCHATFGFRLGQLATEQLGVQVWALRLREGEDRATPVRLGHGVVVGEECFVEIGRGEDGGGEDERP
jgi:hypothetical protein